MSITPTAGAPGLASDVALAVEVLSRIGTAVAAGEMGDPLVGAALARDLQRVADLAEGSSSVLLRRAERTGDLREAGFGSVRSFLVDAGLSTSHANAVSARGKDFELYPRVRDAVLGGAITSDAARVITTGVKAAIADLPREQKAAQRAVAEDILLPIAEGSPIQDLQAAVGAIGAFLDPEGAAARALRAMERSTLSCAQVGETYVVHAVLPIDAGAALITLLEQRVDQMFRSGALAPDLLPSDDDAEDARRRALARPRLWAEAFRELVLGVLSDGAVGTKHNEAPHVLLLVEDADRDAGRPGVVLVPGQGPVPVPAETVERILCDADVTEVRTDTEVPDSHGRTAVNGLAVAEDPRDARTGGRYPPARPRRGDQARGAPKIDPHDLIGTCSHVQCVGRRSRTATKAQWAALIARDRHCRFPGCAVDPMRCEAHHVTPWERGGSTCLSNLVLLCSRHHHLVHEGRWRIDADDSLDLGHPDRWVFRPPEGGRHRHLHLGWTALLQPEPQQRR